MSGANVLRIPMTEYGLNKMSQQEKEGKRIEWDVLWAMLTPGNAITGILRVKISKRPSRSDSQTCCDQRPVQEITG